MAQQITVELPDDLMAFLGEMVEAGEAPSRDEVVIRALKRARLRAHLDREFEAESRRRRALVIALVETVARETIGATCAAHPDEALFSPAAELHFDGREVAWVAAHADGVHVFLTEADELVELDEVPFDAALERVRELLLAQLARD